MRFILALVLVACGGDTSMSTEDYDKSCGTEDTCRPVFVGDVCGCRCQVDAISYTQETVWAQERSRKVKRCDEVLNCEPCPSITVTCDDGTCAASLALDSDT